MNIKNQLRSILGSQQAPFLFVGSGFSLRYSGAPSWEGLLRELADYTDLSYEYYASGDNMPLVATKISKEIHNAWHKTNKLDSFKEHKNPYSFTTEESALKFFTSEIIRNTTTFEKFPEVKRLPEILQEELEILPKINISGIITTNYDELLELIFPKFKTFIGQDSMFISTPQGFGEIYKIHGSISSPESLIITSKDYEDFNRRNAYLAAKLMTIFIERPVIFIGYSISDNNIRSILAEIIACLDLEKHRERLKILNDLLLFIEWDEDSPAGMSTIEKELGGHIINIPCLRVPNFLDVFSYLADTSPKISMHLLRLIKEQIYQVSLENDPNNKIVALDFDDLKNPSTQDIEFIIGFGLHDKYAISRRGWSQLSSKELIDNYINDDQEDYSTFEYIKYALFTAKTNQWIPIHKYLKKTSLVEFKENIDVDKNQEKFKNRILHTITNYKKGRVPSTILKNKSFEHIIRCTEYVPHRRNKIKNSPMTAVHKISAVLQLPLSDIPVGPYRKFLYDNIQDLDEQVRNRAICVLDYLENSDNEVSKYYLDKFKL